MPTAGTPGALACRADGLHHEGNHEDDALVVTERRERGADACDYEPTTPSGQQSADTESKEEGFSVVRHQEEGSREECEQEERTVGGRQANLARCQTMEQVETSHKSDRVDHDASNGEASADQRRGGAF